MPVSERVMAECVDDVDVDPDIVNARTSHGRTPDTTGGVYVFVHRKIKTKNEETTDRQPIQKAKIWKQQWSTKASKVEEKTMYEMIPLIGWSVSLSRPAIFFFLLHDSTQTAS